MKRGLFIILLVTLYSCNGTLPGNNKTKDLALADSTMFDDNQVKLILAHQSVSEEQKNVNKKANDLFLNGVDEFRNKKNEQHAEQLFTQSILLHPTAKAYYELGNASINLKNYDKAIRAYHVAEQLGFEPVSKLFYNTACAYSLSKKSSEALKYLEYALEAGYANREKIMSDPDLAGLKDDYSFKETYREAMSGSSDPVMVLWQSFKGEFAKAFLPVTFDKKTKSSLNEHMLLGYDYEKFVSEMRNEKFSRETGKEFYHYAIISENNNYTALVYAEVNTIIEDETARPSSYILVSFDNKGTLIDKKIIGGQVELEELYKVCTINPNLTFTIAEYKNTYQKDTKKDGYENNPTIKTELQATKYYKIADDGKFVEASQPLAMK